MSPIVYATLPATSTDVIAAVSVLIGESERTLNTWLYGLLALALLLIVSAIRAKATRPIVSVLLKTASIAVVVLAALSDNWVHPGYTEKFCSLAGGYSETARLNAAENFVFRSSKKPTAEFEEQVIWGGDVRFAAIRSPFPPHLTPITYIKYAYHGGRVSRYVLSPLKGFANRVASVQCDGAKNPLQELPTSK